MIPIKKKYVKGPLVESSQKKNNNGRNGTWLLSQMEIKKLAKRQNSTSHSSHAIIWVCSMQYAMQLRS
jgi:hypothetical protein